jgi:hypothetical protein
VKSGDKVREFAYLRVQQNDMKIIKTSGDLSGASVMDENGDKRM